MNKTDIAFIVGCGHSGTSLLIRILGAHSHVFAIPEETSLFIKEEDVNVIIERMNNYELLAIKNSNSLLVEKTPNHVHYINRICNIFPDAKIIGIIRDPRDVACSIKARGFTFEQGIKRWIKDNQALNAEMGRPNLCILKLDDLVEHPDKIIRTLLDFLDLPYEDLTSYHLKQKNWYSKTIVKEKPSTGKWSNHVTLRNWQINQPLFKTTQRFASDMDAFDCKVFDKYLNEVLPLAQKLDQDLTLSNSFQEIT